MSLCRLHPPFLVFFLVLFYEWRSLFPLPSCYWPVGDEKYFILPPFLFIVFWPRVTLQNLKGK